MTQYLICKARKDQGKIPIAVCHKRKCVCLVSKDGKLICDYEATVKRKGHRTDPGGVQSQTPRGKGQKR
jgi:hypothetical protein